MTIVGKKGRRIRGEGGDYCWYKSLEDVYRMKNVPPSRWIENTEPFILIYVE